MSLLKASFYNKKYLRFFIVSVLVVSILGSVIPIEKVKADEGFFSWIGVSFGGAITGASTAAFKGVSWAIDKISPDFLAIIIGVPLGIIGAVILVFSWLAWALSVAARGILLFVLSPYFTEFSYTNPATNPIIAHGLNVTQNLVNMILILALIYIAMVTILNLQGYETKKMLLTFIGVALLVNFAPVICGVIVDAANIIMNYFINSIYEGIGATLNQASGLLTQYQRILPFPVQEPEEIIGGFIGLVILFFYFMGLAFVYWIYVFLFVVRYYMIWLLVILSPLAFACYAVPIPSVRDIATKWWSHFFGWSFVGVTAGFFLYLSESYAKIAMENAPSEGTGSWADIGMFMANLNANISFHIFALIFLAIGLLMALQTSAIGTQATIRGAKRTAAWGGKAGWWTAKKTASRTSALVSSEAKNRLSSWSSEAMPETYNPLKLAGWATKRTIGKAGTYMVERDKKDIKEAEKKYEGSSQQKLNKGATSVYATERMGAVNAALKEKRLGDLMADKSKGGVGQEVVLKTIEEMRGTSPGDFKKARKALPQYAERLVADDEINEARIKTGNPALTKRDFIVSKMSRADFENTSDDIFDGAEGKEMAKSILLHAKVQIIPVVAENFGETARVQIQDQIDSGITPSVSMKSYLKSNTGQSLLGINIP